jgi:hypothetical protein
VQLAWPALQVLKGQPAQLVLPIRQPDRKGLKAQRDWQALADLWVRLATPDRKALAVPQVRKALAVPQERRGQRDNSRHRAPFRAV